MTKAELEKKVTELETDKVELKGRLEGLREMDKKEFQKDLDHLRDINWKLEEENKKLKEENIQLIKEVSGLKEQIEKLKENHKATIEKIAEEQEKIRKNEKLQHDYYKDLLEQTSKTLGNVSTMTINMINGIKAIGALGDQLNESITEIHNTNFNKGGN